MQVEREDGYLAVQTKLWRPFGDWNVKELSKDGVITNQTEFSVSISRSISQLRIARLQARDVTELSTAAAVALQIELRKAILRHLAIVRSGFGHEAHYQKLGYRPRAALPRRRAFRQSGCGRRAVRA